MGASGSKAALIKQRAIVGRGTGCRTKWTETVAKQASCGMRLHRTLNLQRHPFLAAATTCCTGKKTAGGEKTFRVSYLWGGRHASGTGASIHQCRYIIVVVGHSLVGSQGMGVVSCSDCKLG